MSDPQTQPDDWPGIVNEPGPRLLGNWPDLLVETWKALERREAELTPRQRSREVWVHPLDLREFMDRVERTKVCHGPFRVGLAGLQLHTSSLVPRRSVLVGDSRFPFSVLAP